jgi:hypothetical protein
LEDKLQAQAAKKGYSGKRADAYTYGTLNNMGAMHGSKITEKGRAMDRKHASDLRKQADAVGGR